MRTIAMTLTGFMGAFAGGQAALWGYQIRCQQPELATLRWQVRASANGGAKRFICVCVRQARWSDASPWLRAFVALNDDEING